MSRYRVFDRYGPFPVVHSSLESALKTVSFQHLFDMDLPGWEKLDDPLRVVRFEPNQIRGTEVVCMASL